MTAHPPLKLVLCEGKDDRLVMQALADHAGIGEELTFEDYGNVGTLRDYLKALRVRPDFRADRFAQYFSPATRTPIRQRHGSRCGMP